MSHPEHQYPDHGNDAETVVLPTSTAAPLVIALAVTLLAVGCVTSWVLSGLGAVMLLTALAMWITQLLPGRGEHEVAWVPSEMRARVITPVKVAVEPRPPRLIRRMQVPERVHPYSSGVRGGLVGGAAMGLVALAYGVISHRGIWYPVNLLAAMLLPRMADLDGVELEKFDAIALVMGIVIHVVVSAGAGLFYGMLLPTLPRYPALWGGIVAPLLWTGAIWSFMGVLNPVMNSRVDWPWFIASQVVFGLVAGWYVVRSQTVATSSEGSRAGRGRTGR